MARVFERVSVYPQLPDYTLIEWEVHADFNKPAPWDFTVQFSRSGNPDASDWTDIATSAGVSKIVFSAPDVIQRSWSTTERWYYRVKLQTGLDTYLSPPEPAWGSLDRQDRLLLREIYRQECLRFRKKAGCRGLLYRRKTWGIRTPNTVDPDTQEVIDPNSTEDFGTGFEDGYWFPFVYWVDVQAGSRDTIEQEQIGTINNRVESARALAFPCPRTNDVWVDCTTGKRYFVGEVKVAARVRTVPAILGLELREAPYTDIVYKLEVPTEPEPDEPEITHSHWFINHWR